MDKIKTLYIWKKIIQAIPSVYGLRAIDRSSESLDLSEDSDEPIRGPWILITTIKGIKQSIKQNPFVEHHGSDMPIIYGQIIVFKKIMGKNIFKEQEIWK